MTNVESLAGIPNVIESLCIEMEGTVCEFGHLPLKRLSNDDLPALMKVRPRRLSEISNILQILFAQIFLLVFLCLEQKLS